MIKWYLVFVLTMFFLGNAEAQTYSPRSGEFPKTVETKIRSIWAKVLPLVKDGTIECYKDAECTEILPAEDISDKWYKDENSGFAYSAYYQTTKKNNKGSYRRLLKSVSPAYRQFGYGVSGQYFLEFKKLKKVLKNPDIDLLAFFANAFLHVPDRPSYYRLLSKAEDALDENLTETSISHVSLRSLDNLDQKLFSQISRTIYNHRDSIQKLIVYKDRDFTTPFILKDSQSRHYISVEDRQFPDAFMDSFSIDKFDANGFFHMVFKNDVVEIHCRTGEVIYTQKQALFALLPKWTVFLFRSVYGVS